jgi:hypothetical protein
LNDGLYGNEHSWINDIPAPFAGVSLGASITVGYIAFGRDNTGVFTDRTLGLYTLQYTNVPNPSASTPEASWTTIGTLDYQFAGGHNFATPSKWHLFSFTPVTATALRLVGSTGNNCFDEIEIYPGGTPLQTWRERHFGISTDTGDAANLADPNGNGINNLMEYALNGDPAGGATGIAILPVRSISPGGNLQLTFNRSHERYDITLTVQASDDLQGPWTDIAQSVNGSPVDAMVPGVSSYESFTGIIGTVTITDSVVITDPAHPRRFLRLKVSTDSGN